MIINIENMVFYEGDICMNCNFQYTDSSKSLCLNYNERCLVFEKRETKLANDKKDERLIIISCKRFQPKRSIKK